ncbi:hypothetical protein [Bacillus suaedae]|uniref:Uncharacterized protein n=1 Tax=Halalkalibacter suaedae TaxID=2822140 RepID=A0A940WXM6_9BACI|nr:hypothetical protein [Bacillus suaedae]MBP3953633.1 hypothetical protein [Bacillus suaedae]
MYRPTVRYEEVYKEYVDNLFNATHLDRNQIIRAALFIAGHTEQFSKIIEPFIKRGMTLPQPLWNETDEDLWLNQKTNIGLDKLKERVQPETQVTRARPRRVQEQPTAAPKMFHSSNQEVSISVSGRQYPLRG